MQVGARILPAAPSQLALSAALSYPLAPPDPELVRIRREFVPLPGDTDRAAHRPRAIVTIEFLRN
jgi:hypothetical protein